MSLVTLTARPHPPGRPDRVAPGRPRSTPSLTITLDLTAGPLTPRLARLVDLLGELVETGEGAVRLSEPTAPRLLSSVPRARRRLPGSRHRPATIRIPCGSSPAPGWCARVTGRSRSPASSSTCCSSSPSSPHRVFTRLQLLASVWGYEHAVARTVDVHVRRLRAKLGADAPLVTTVYGVGYRLADEARVRVDRFR